MRGIHILEGIRNQGYRPKTVTVNFFPCYIPKYPEEFQHIQLEYGPCKDLRPFVRCDVHLHAAKYSKEMGELYERMKDYADTITVLVAEFGDDLGWWWSKETGQQEL